MSDEAGGRMHSRRSTRGSGDAEVGTLFRGHLAFHPDEYDRR